TLARHPGEFIDALRAAPRIVGGVATFHETSRYRQGDQGVPIRSTLARHAFVDDATKGGVKGGLAVTR
ncbi:MAG: hypothetical protein VX796_00430, partial [Pseudomonadota bacterium]|nr:hypothetical protein [Pseudomonadota bacterium]